jgi:N-acetylneuraminic acid mutarotase
MKILLVFLFTGLFSVSSAQIISSLPIPICSGTAETINDSIYYFGGANRWAGTIRYQIVYKFDGFNWSYQDSIPDNNVWGVESVIVGTDIYLIAGWPSGARLIRKYDVINKTWSYLNLSPNSVPYGITVEYLNNHIYLFNTSGNVYEYDLMNDTWQSKTPNIIPAYSLSSVIYNDEIYFAGFYDSTFYKYNPVTDEWTQLANTLYQVSRCAMEDIDDKIYCAGGSEQGSPMNQYRSLLEYDIASDTWSIDQFEMIDNRVWMADVMYNNRFIVLGGLDSGSFAVDIIEEIIPKGPPAVGINEIEQIPSEYFLYQNYPNPFNPITTLSFVLGNSSFVSLKVYNILGQEVSALVNDNLSAGTHNIKFNAANLNSGIYFYKIEAAGIDGSNFTSTKKMTVVK